MESFFKNYFWTVNLLALLIAGYLTAQTVNEHLGDKLFGTEAFAPTATTLGELDEPVEVAPRRGLGKSYADTLFARNLFNSDRVDRVDEPEPEPEPEPEEPEIEDDPDGEIPDSELNVTLIGTMVGPQPSLSMASLELEGEGKIVHIGSELKRDPDDEMVLAVVEDIKRRVVFVRESGELRRIRLWGEPEEQRGAQRPTVRRPPPRPQPQVQRPSQRDTDYADGIKKVSMYEYDIDRSMLEEQLADLSQLGREARVVPNYRDGQYQGFKLIGVRPGSMYRALGIRSGDIIQRVNGQAIDSPNKAIQLFEQLRTQERIELDIERRGQSRTLSYSIK